MRSSRFGSDALAKTTLIQGTWSPLTGPLYPLFRSRFGLHDIVFVADFSDVTPVADLPDI